MLLKHAQKGDLGFGWKFADFIECVTNRVSGKPCCFAPFTIPSNNSRVYFEKTLKATAEDVSKEYADCDSEFRDGVPCEEIVNPARERDIDLIIISTHHYNRLTRLACGCDAEHILRNMPCSILILQANTTPERPAAL